MKTLTTFAAVAALVAGVSIASAADSSMNKSSTTGSSTMGSSSSTAQVTGTGKFCAKGSSGALNCQYASMSDCQKAATGGTTCQANPHAGTTGSK